VALNVYRLPFAILAFLALVMVIPVLMFYVGTTVGTTRPTVQFLITMFPAALALLALTSWIQPG
jgi:uncharacterized membrane protein